jgi:type IV pilus assembly protein PilF
MMRAAAMLWVLALSACASGGGLGDVAPGRSASEAATINLQLAVEYMKLDNLPVAREKMERALRQDPDNPSVQATAGVLFERLGDEAKAERYFASAARIGKNDPNIQNSYAGFLCRKGKTAAGEKLFLEVARNPLYQTPEMAYTNAGVCVRGTPAGGLAAEGYFRQALNIRPNAPEAMLQLGDLMMERNDPQQSRELVQHYLSVNKPTPEVYWLGVRAERKLGDMTAAAGYARRLEAEFPSSEQAQMLRSGIPR